MFKDNLACRTPPHPTYQSLAALHLGHPSALESACRSRPRHRFSLLSYLDNYDCNLSCVAHWYLFSHVSILVWQSDAFLFQSSPELHRVVICFLLLHLHSSTFLEILANVLRFSVPNLVSALMISLDLCCVSLLLSVTSAASSTFKMSLTLFDTFLRSLLPPLVSPPRPLLILPRPLPLPSHLSLSSFFFAALEMSLQVPLSLALSSRPTDAASSPRAPSSPPQPATASHAAFAFPLRFTFIFSTVWLEASFA